MTAAEFGKSGHHPDRADAGLPATNGPLRRSMTPSAAVRFCPDAVEGVLGGQEENLLEGPAR